MLFATDCYVESFKGKPNELLMKHLFTALLICSSAALLAQPKDYRCEVFQMDSSTGEYEETPLYTEEVKYFPDGNLKEREYISPSMGTRYEYVYSNGILSEQYYSSFDVDSRTWSLPGRYRWFKDAKGRDTLILEEQPGTDPGTYITIAGRRYSHTEDSLGRLIKRDESSYFFNAWQLRYSIELSYTDSDSFPSELRFFTIQSGSMELYDHWTGIKWMNGFNLDNLNSGLIAFKKSSFSGNTTIYYDSSVSDAHMQYWLRMRYDSASQAYENVQVSFTEFDAKQRRIKVYQVQWRNGQSDTTYKSNSVHVEDANGNLSISYVVTYSAHSGTETRKHVYSKPLSSQNRVARKLAVFPNPIAANGQVRLPEGEWNAVQLSSLNGKIFHIELQHSDRFQVPSIIPGIYFLQATTRAGQVYQAKIQVR
ncbi:MAG: T9SS type A sorting domain-containing protein [Bacteroidetes bacterium]|nr:MAG: T9SS type A sorting domain-containing protein [Bacteroidota bacterium]